MAKRLPRTDVVIIGLGWTGSILAQELTDAGLDVVAIERGPWRDTASDFSPGTAPDELRYAVRKEIFQSNAQETLTFRNNQADTALPIRRWSGFLPGSGVGGAGVHWNGHTWRFLPSDFRMRSNANERYGAKFLADDITIQDWGLTYDELEPFYDRFEYLCGISGKAGNLNGQIQDGGNPFEGARKRDYPTPPMAMTYGPTLYAKAAREVGFHPFPMPSANLSQAYTNPLGVRMGPCSYCGFCEWFGCANYSKSSPQTTILPVLVRKPNFTARTGCEVLKVNLDKAGKKATGVTYVDPTGEEYEQPADIVLVCSYSFFNVRMLLLSGIGQPYDGRTGEGVVGRNYAYQTMGGVRMFFGEDTNFNPFIGAGAVGQIVDDFNGDNFDHGPLGFIGGAYLGMTPTNGRPISNRPTPPGTPRWGSAWKKATVDNYARSAGITSHGSSVSHRGAFLDLDPTYKDPHGRPLLRMTFEFHDNDVKMSKYTTDQAAKIAAAMKPKQMFASSAAKPYNVTPYQTTHNTGGTVMGEDPKTSVLNKYLQSWDVSNVFVFGASAFPQNAGYNPTGTVGALAYWGADAIINRYLRSPGPLV